MTVRFNSPLSAPTRLMNTTTRFASSETSSPLQVVQKKATALTAQNLNVTAYGNETEAVLRPFDAKQDQLPSGVQCAFVMDTFGLVRNPSPSEFDDMILYLDANLAPVYAQQTAQTVVEAQPAGKPGESGKISEFKSVYQPVSLTDANTQKAYKEGLALLASPEAQLMRNTVLDVLSWPRF